MKVFDVCAISTVSTPVLIKGDNGSTKINYKVPDKIKDANKEIMDMEVKVIEIEFGNLVLYVGNVELIDEF